jgi:Ca-activated chloride channel family protein
MTPRTETTFTVRPDRRLIRPNSHSNRFLLARITAPRATSERARPPVNQAIVLDRSRSMSGEKLRVAKAAVEEAIARLQPDDRFSVVVYDDVVDVVVGSTSASSEARRGAVDRLGAIEARGSTNLGDGWLRGCEQVASHLVEQGVNRCLLLTDGLANVGITDPAQLSHHAAELRARGVSTSTFGVGNDFDERLLQELADAGGGHFYYIADAPQIRDAITSEVGETLEIVARDVHLEITARDDIRIEPISPYRAATRGNRTAVSLGDLGSEQVVEVVLRLSFPYGQVGQETGAIVALTDRTASSGRPALEKRIPCVSPGRTRTIGRTTTSRATMRSIGRWRVSSRHAPARKPCSAIASATTPVPGMSSTRRRHGSVPTPETIRRCSG